MQAMILVDLQNDFVDGGALPVKNGTEVIAVANTWSEQFDWVVATQDWHPANHGSFASQQNGLAVGDCFELNGIPQIVWPDHCVQETRGAQFVPGLNVQKIDDVIQKGTDPQVDSYSGFFDNDRQRSTGLERLLRDGGCQEVFVMGLATDYCVKFTALDAVGLGFKTHLIVAGCRGVNLQPTDERDAIEQMRAAGVRMIAAN